jgi:hypothetical protein
MNVTTIDPRMARHFDVTPRELADFVLYKGAPVKDGEALAELDHLRDRSLLLPPTMPTPEVLDAKGDLKYNDGLEHYPCFSPRVPRGIDSSRMLWADLLLFRAGPNSYRNRPEGVLNRLACPDSRKRHFLSTMSS